MKTTPERGIHVIQLSDAENLERVLEALGTHAVEHQRREPIIESTDLKDFYHKISAIERSVNSKMNISEQSNAVNTNSHWAKEAAAILSELIAAYPAISEWSKSDEDNDQKNGIDHNLAQIEQRIRGFCYGNFLQNNQSGKIDHWPIYEALDSTKQKRLLQIALHLGNRSLYLSAVSGRVDVEKIYIEQFGDKLTGDEKAQIYLDRGRSYLKTNETLEAKADFQKARDFTSNVELRTEISIELREVLFSEGDAAGLNAELLRPLDAHSGYTLCRRGCDALVLGKRSDSIEYYKQALDRSLSEDERYVALWGLQAASWTNHYFPTTSEEFDRYLEEARGILPETRPKTEAMFRLSEQAGQQWLSGDRVPAIRLLEKFLNRARRMGWPLTAQHNVSFPIEMAANQMVRLLLVDDHEGEPARSNDIKQALTILIRFGLSSKTDKLLGDEFLKHFVGMDEQKWLRKFLLQPRGIPKQDGARNLCALFSIPLLEDTQIETYVIGVVNKTKEYIVSSMTEEIFSVSLDEQWKYITLYAECIPEKAVLAILSILPIGSDSRVSSICSNMENWPWQTWQRGGFLNSFDAKGEIENIQLSLIAAIENPRLKTDWIWRRHIYAICHAFAEFNLFSKLNKQIIIEKLYSFALKKAITKSTEKTIIDGDLDNSETVGLLCELNPKEPRLAAYVGSMLKVYERVSHSTLLSSWMEVIAKLVPYLNDEQIELVTRIAKEQTAVNDSKHPWIDAPVSTAYLLEQLEKNIHSAGLLGGTVEIAKMISQLGTKDVRALACLRSLSLPRSSDYTINAVRMIKNSLGQDIPINIRLQALRTISWWCNSSTRNTDVTKLLIKEIIKKFESDSPKIRARALHVFSYIPNNLRTAYVKETSDVILKNLSHDPDWNVRSSAAVNLGAVWAGTKWEEEAMREAHRLLNDPIALVRRCAAIAIREFTNSADTNCKSQGPSPTKI